jgi:hypothetical protein
MRLAQRSYDPHIDSHDSQSLGALHKNQGELPQAEKMHIRTLHGYEKELGLENPL